MNTAISQDNKNYTEYVWIIFGSVLAIILNINPISLVAGAEVVFGNAIAVALVIRYGLVAGIFVSLCASIAVSTVWAHYLAVIPNLLELFIVYVAVRFRQHPIVYGVGYWLTLGAIIVYFSYEYFTNFPDYTNTAITLKYIINGILTTSLGYILQLSIGQKNSVRKAFIYFSFKQVITFVIFITVLVGVCINAYFWLSETKSIKRNHVELQLEMNATYSSKEIENYVGNTLEKISLAAKQFSLLNVKPTQKSLDAIAVSTPGVLTMLVSDSQGTIVKTYPQDLLKMVLNNNENISDREYFTSVKSTKKPYISDVFQGRGFGNDPIVALSAPIFIDNTFSGILQASLSLAYFQTQDRKQIDESQGMLILDAENRVIYSSNKLGFTYLQNLTNSSLLQQLQLSDEQFYVDTNNNDYFVKTDRGEQLGWQTITFLPREVYEREVLNLFSSALALLIGFISVAMLLGTAVSQRLSLPVRMLSERITEASSSGHFERININSDSAISEVNALTESINEFSVKYRETLESLKQAVEEANAANLQLAQINSNLEKIIDRKTQDIRNALQKANQASEAKSAFLANMSHEIRTPLNGIYGTLQILQSGYSANNQKNELLEQAIFSAKSLTTILNDVLDFSKIEAGELLLESIPFELDTLVNNVMGDYTQKAQSKNIELVSDIENECPKIWQGDPVRVRQILANLVSNAEKFTEKGSVKVLCRHIIRDNQTYLLIQVSDTGIGMSKDGIQHLFERFSQADVSTTRKYGGTGLGMAITRRLVDLMKGDIRCESEESIGTQFSVELPLTPIESKAISEKVTTLPDTLPDLSNLKLVLVEDNDINIIVFNKMMESTNAKILVATNGKKGVELCRRFKPDLVFMDIHMPVMDGVEATKILRKEMPELVIIAVTANVMKTDVDNYFRAGFNDYIAKPLEKTELSRVLTDYLSSN